MNGPLKDHQKHVLYQRETNSTGIKQAYCGAPIGQFDWHFMDADHAVSSVAAGSAVSPCPECTAKIIEILSKP